MADDEAVSAGGGADGASSLVPVFASAEHLRALESHYAQAFGVAAPILLHEARSIGVHVDTYVYPPTAGRNFVTLATVGMSARPMRPPEGMEEFTHAEVVLYLDPNWDFDSVLGDLPDELLRAAATIAHITESWISDGHTVEMPGNESVPGSLLTDLMLRWAPEEDGFQHFVLPDGNPCHFLWVVPITEAECYVARTDGSQAVIDRLDAVSYRNFDIDRACLITEENRGQRRARKRAQKARARRPRDRTVSQIRCELHESCAEDHG